MTLDLTLHPHTPPRQSSWAEQVRREVPRCGECGHHPNAHASGNCNVVQERATGKGKCGCSAIRVLKTKAA